LNKLNLPEHNLFTLWQLYGASLKLLTIIGKVSSLQQPLRSLVSNETWKEVENITAGETEMVSILRNYFHGAA
jgi:hypothetical protein